MDKTNKSNFSTLLGEAMFESNYSETQSIRPISPVRKEVCTHNVKPLPQSVNPLLHQSINPLPQSVKPLPQSVNPLLHQSVNPSSQNNSIVSVEPTKTIKVQESVEDVMKDLEQRINPKTIQEGMILLNESVKQNNPSLILEPMLKGAEEFKERMGRNMTYSEMRMMWG